MSVHQPVMCKEAIDFLNLKPGNTVLDATLGGAGHAIEILKKITPGGKLIGLDADEAAIKRSEENLRDFAGSFKLMNENFRNLDRALSGENNLIMAAKEISITDAQFLLDVGEIQSAQDYIIARREQLDGDQHYHLPPLAENLEEKGSYLAAVLIDRAFLLAVEHQRVCVGIVHHVVVGDVPIEHELPAGDEARPEQHVAPRIRPDELDGDIQGFSPPAFTDH